MKMVRKGAMTSVCRRSRRGLVAAASLLVLASVAASSAQAAVPADFIGIDDPYIANRAARPGAFAAQRAAGIGLVRQAMDMSTIEVKKGKYNFADYDNLVRRAASTGLAVMPVLLRKPKVGARFYFPPKNADFARFAKAAARRYGTKGSFWKKNRTVPKRPIKSWQLWNEPNLKLYWGNKPSARAYVSLLAAGGKAIKSVEKRAEIVTAGLPDSRNGIALNRYVAQLYRAGGKRAFDVLAIHGYNKTAAGALRKLQSIRKLMNKQGDKGGKLWETEIGWADTAGADTSGPCLYNVGAAGQAKQVASMLILFAKNRAKLKLRGLVYYSWRDLTPYPPQNLDTCGLHLGLLNADGSAKPALASFAKAAAQIK